MDIQSYTDRNLFRSTSNSFSNKALTQVVRFAAGSRDESRIVKLGRRAVVELFYIGAVFAMSIELLARTLLYIVTPAPAPRNLGFDEGEYELPSKQELVSYKRESAYFQTKMALMTTTSLIFRNLFDRNAYHAPELAPAPFDGDDMSTFVGGESALAARVGDPDPFY